MKLSGVWLLIIIGCSVTLMFLTTSCGNQQGTVTDGLNAKITAELLAARQNNVPIPSLKKTYPALSVDQAYEIQFLLTGELEKEYGIVAGYKLGYADSAALKKSGLKIPAYGPLFKRQILNNGGDVPLADFRNFSIENEVVFRVGKLIDTSVSSIDELRPYIHSVSVGYDMSEGIFTEPSSVEDFIANGAGSKYFMTGAAVDPDSLDLSNLHLTIVFNDETVYAGGSSTVLGNPWYAMLAIANDLQKRGRPLKEGDLIFSGKLDAAFKPDGEAGGIYYGDGGKLGTVQCVVK